MSSAVIEKAEMVAEAGERADFSRIRYAQCWEDADVLLDGLDVRPGDTCVSVCSAGDNTLSLLTRDPARVIAVDLNPSQLHCMELRKAAYLTLTYPQLLEFIGAQPSSQRKALFARCLEALAPEARTFWESRPADIEAGFGTVGKFENYFRIFRTRVLPLVHRRATIQSLLKHRTPAARRQFFDTKWDTARWRLMFRLFFSRRMMGKLGRDPEFFRYVEGNVGDQIIGRAKHALSELDPSRNPYMGLILTGAYGEHLPHALREEHFETIRSRLDRVHTHLGSIEGLPNHFPDLKVDRFNLSDIFEYMSPDAYESLLRQLVSMANPGGRLFYWNMLAPRTRPDSLASCLDPRQDLAQRLHLQDKACFYSRIVIEDVIGSCS